jgi:uncharacterized protein (DUF2461 family)
MKRRVRLEKSLAKRSGRYFGSRQVQAVYFSHFLQANARRVPKMRLLSFVQRHLKFMRTNLGRLVAMATTFVMVVSNIFLHNRCASLFLNTQLRIRSHAQEKVPYNREVHTSLRNCGSTSQNLLCTLLYVTIMH